jgi:hypothetical protein
MKTRSSLNVPLIHKIFAKQIAESDESGELYFYRQPTDSGIMKGVVFAKVSVANTTVAFQRLAKRHDYDPDGIYAADGLPIIYSKDGDINAV